MKKTLLLAGTALALSLSTANAQVVVEELIETILGDSTARFGGIAENIGDIDASINISSFGQNPGEQTSTASTDATGNASETAGTLADVAMTAATLVAGAINTFDADITEGAASLTTSAASNTSLTNASADFSKAVGSGVGVVSLAFNDGTLNSSINVNVGGIGIGEGEEESVIGGGNFTFAAAALDGIEGQTAGLSTLGAGAINTSNITASFISTGDNLCSDCDE